MIQEVDVVVIGLGPGGEDLAGSLAEADLKVVGIEKSLVGGECPYWGCVPSKMMIRAADMLAEGRRIPGMAGRSTVSADWAPVAQRIRSEATDNWDDKVAVDRFVGKGGQFVRGLASFTARDKVEVAGASYRATRAVVIATGTAPAIPPIPGLADVPYWTNHEAIEAETLPRSLIILGGGAIGLELAQVFTRFGVRVTVVEAADRLLPLEEPESGEVVGKVLSAEGAEVRVGASVVGVGRDAELITVATDSGLSLSAEKLLVATGRRADLRQLGVENAGLDAQAHFVAVDEHLRAGERLWAIGDVTGKGLFTHIAMYQSRIATADILGKSIEAVDYRALPRVTFTDPEVGSVGMSEAQAIEQGIEVRVGIAQVSSSARGWIHGPGNEGFIKLIGDRRREILVGASSVGPRGGEVLSMLTLAIKAEIPITTLREMIYAYPTFHRGVEDALRDLAGR